MCNHSQGHNFLRHRYCNLVDLVVQRILIVRIRISIVEEVIEPPFGYCAARRKSNPLRNASRSVSSPVVATTRAKNRSGTVVAPSSIVGAREEGFFARNSEVGATVVSTSVGQPPSGD
jgi:hypothetical protein